MFYADDTQLYISVKPSSPNVALDLLSDFVSIVFIIIEILKQTTN